MIESVRLTSDERQKLINIKRETGIENWNTLCRWALCLSLEEKGPPPRLSQSVRGAVEMTWETFGGPNAAIYLALLEADRHDHDQDSTLVEWLYRHLNRGIFQLADIIRAEKDRPARAGIEKLIAIAI